MVGTHFNCDHNSGKLSAKNKCWLYLIYGYIEEKNRIYSILKFK